MRRTRPRRRASAALAWAVREAERRVDRHRQHRAAVVAMQGTIATTWACTVARERRTSERAAGRRGRRRPASRSCSASQARPESAAPSSEPGSWIAATPCDDAHVTTSASDDTTTVGNPRAAVSTDGSAPRTRRGRRRRGARRGGPSRARTCGSARRPRHRSWRSALQHVWRTSRASLHVCYRPWSRSTTWRGVARAATCVGAALDDRGSHRVPVRGPVLLRTHVSDLDPLVIGYVLHRRHRRWLPRQGGAVRATAARAVAAGRRPDPGGAWDP